jgi:hypothetical protein
VFVAIIVLLRKLVVYCNYLAHAPSPGEHLGLFWREKKHQVFSPAAANET